ncbi:MAG: DUF6088 family protein [Phycisphaerales bacterium JB058]
MKTTQHQILDRIRRTFGGDGAVVTPRDFLDLAGRDAVDQALNRLVRSGALIRVGRGLYHLPRRNDALGITIPPDADKVADALGRQTGSRVAPSPAVTANRLGLSTQIPAKPIYMTSGRSRSVRVGARTFRLKHASRMPDTHSPVGRVIQAIQGRGKDIDQHDLVRLRGTLSDKGCRDLIDQARDHAGWVIDIARRIAAVPSDTRELVQHG